ncbi:coiled-coil and C2 domain-containing protein 1-like [Glandiceps talaboti]
MFSKKKGGRDKTEAAKKLGLLEVPDLETFMNKEVYGGDDDDEDFEAELAALTGQGSAKPAVKSKKSPLPMSVIDKMAAESLKDDDDVDMDDDWENDEDLMSELQELAEDDDNTAHPAPTPSPKPSPKPQEGANMELVTLLKDRKTMYEAAIDNAKSTGDSSKVRRYERGWKTIKDLEKSAKAGKPVNEDDIPPPVATGKPKATNPPVAMDTQQSTPVEEKGAAAPVKEEIKAPVVQKDAKFNAEHKMLLERKNQYKVAALTAKRANDMPSATKYIKIAKQFEMVIEAMEQGKEVDLSNVPPPPPPQPGSTQQSPTVASPPKVVPSPQSPQQAVDEKPPDAFGVPSAPKTAMEALQQRLEKYKSSEQSAKQEGNSSKARRMGRIVKQFEDAIKKEKLGKPVEYDDLPCPPGFPPIPGTSEASQSASGLPMAPPNATEVLPGAAAQAAPPAAAKGAQPQQTSPPKQGTSPKKLVQSINQQQAQLLRERQRQYKIAALQAKNRGDIDEAKRLLATAKGFDRMIDASENGLPVNLKTIPPPPGASTDFEIVEGVDSEEPTGSREQMYKKLEETLKKQVETCNSNSQYFTQLGDINSAKQFDKWSTSCRQDLDTVKNAYAHGDPVPRFHYDQKTFRMVKCNTDLNDNELEIVIVRGINYYLPSGMNETDLNTYVKYELPYPKDDDGQSGKTSTVKQTNNPLYDASFKLRIIDRKQRSLGRHFKRLVLKLEVFYERGFFKGDKCLGQASLKLTDLDSKCEIHEGIKLTESRKAIGGTLEIKVRVRQPLGSPEVQDIKERWLVIDGIKTAAPIAAQQKVSPKGGSQHVAKSVNSIEVLKLELTLNDRKVKAYKAKGQAPPRALIENQDVLMKKLQNLEAALKRGGKQAARVYVSQLQSAAPHYHAEAQQYVRQGNKEMATLCLTKKKLVENEMRSWQQKC